MAVKLDNIHYSFRGIDGYNKPFNFIVSPRELGKTTMMWNIKIYRKWKVNKKPWIYLVRQVVEITDSLNKPNMFTFSVDLILLNKLVK